MSTRMVLTSHSPLSLMNMRETHAGAHERFASTLSAIANELARFDPELVVVFGPDHFNGFFYDLMPSFCVGARAQATSDWGLEGGLLQVREDVALACVRHLHLHGFDSAISYDMKVDHGTTIPLTQLGDRLDRFCVLPVFINCAADPRPSMQRVRMFGEEVGRFLAGRFSRIAVLGSGGLSHDPPTPRLGTAAGPVARRLIERAVPASGDLRAREERVMAAARALVRGEGPCMPPNPDWDTRFLQHIVAWDTLALDAINDRELDELAGFGGHEVRAWVAASAACRVLAGDSFEARRRHYEVVPEWLTGMGVVTGAVV